MSAGRLLILGVVLLLVAWTVSGTGLLRQVPGFLRFVVTVIFIYGGVRAGLSIAIIAFDLSPISYLIPVFLGILAWWLRPGRNVSP